MNSAMSCDLEPCVGVKMTRNQCRRLLLKASLMITVGQTTGPHAFQVRVVGTSESDSAFTASDLAPGLASLGIPSWELRSRAANQAQWPTGVGTRRASNSSCLQVAYEGLHRRARWFKFAARTHWQSGRAAECVQNSGCRFRASTGQLFTEPG
jgi:hypothetical protein